MKARPARSAGRRAGRLYLGLTGRLAAAEERSLNAKRRTSNAEFGYFRRSTFCVLRSGRYFQRPASSASTRSRVGGWVLNRPIKPPGENGLMMNMWAVAGLASIGATRDAASIFCRALTRPLGDPGNRRAAGVRVELARPRNRGLNQHRGQRREDDRREERDRTAAPAVVRARRRKTSRTATIIMIAAASVAATELVRMSRCLTCASSCASTPSSSSSFRSLQDPFAWRRQRRARGSGRSRMRSATGPG